MDGAVIGVIDFSATDALVAAIYGFAAALYRILAIQGFGQRGSQRLQFFDVVAEKKISMTEPSTLKRTLQQFDPGGLGGEIFESHRAKNSCARSYGEQGNFRNSRPQIGLP